MPLTSIKLPPGIFRNGTPYATKGRWADGNLVRWRDGALRPIGGWVRRQTPLGVDMPSLVADPSTETVRDVLSYRANNGDVYTAFGSNANLFIMDKDNAVTTVTPAGFTGGDNSVTQLIGYGIGPFGTGTYGTPRNLADAKPVPISRWSFDVWGENLLAAFQGEGKIYEYPPGGPIAELTNSPSLIQDFVVTQQRIVMAITKDVTKGIRRIEWSDREDNNDWTSTVSNYAGGINLDGEGDLIGLYKLQNEVLVLSETDAHIAQYINAPFVYGFRRVGANCGPISDFAVAKTDRFAIWLGSRNFWIYDGSLKPLQCDVIDYLFATIDPTQVSKLLATTISDFSEIWWFYQSFDSDDIDSYVSYNYFEGHWNYGKLARTAATDKGTLNNPLMVDSDGIVWSHEQAGVIPDGDVFAITGPLELDEGNRNVAVRYVFPDTQSKGQVEIELLTRQHSTDTDYVHGPFAFSDPISTTGVLGREVRMKVTGLTNTWEFGNPRFDVQAVGGGYR